MTRGKKLGLALSRAVGPHDAPQVDNRAETARRRDISLVSPRYVTLATTDETALDAFLRDRV